MVVRAYTSRRFIAMSFGGPIKRLFLLLRGFSAYTYMLRVHLHVKQSPPLPFV